MTLSLNFLTTPYYYLFPPRHHEVPIHNLEELKVRLTSLPPKCAEWKYYQNDIQRLLRDNQSYPDVVDQFIKAVMQDAVQKNFTDFIDFMAGVVDLPTIENLARHKTANSDFRFQNVVDWAVVRASFLPLQQSKSYTEKISLEWKRWRPMVIYFIPHLIDTFIGAFSFLDTRKRFTNLWEKSLLIGIVCNFFIIPYVLIQTLKPIFLATAKVYAVAASIIVGVGILLAAYHRWFRPRPDEVVNCTNLDKIIETEMVESKVGQTEDLNRMTAHLLTGSNVLLIGKSGDGKTALVHHLIQLKQQGKLPKALEDLLTFEIDCGLMISNTTYGHAELINQTKEQIEGFEEKILFFFDNIHDIVTSTAFSAFKKHFTDGAAKTRFIAATTFEGYQKIIQADASGEFRRRIVPLVIDGSEESQNRLILSELVNRLGHNIPVENGAIEKVLALTTGEAGEHYLPAIGRPAKAIKIMQDAIGRCQVTYNPHFVSQELAQLRQEVQVMRSRMGRSFGEDEPEFNAYVRLTERCRQRERELENENLQVQKIKGLLDKEKLFKQDYVKLTHRIASAQNHAHISEKEKKRYLLHYFYGLEAFKQNLDREFQQVAHRREVKVDAALVEKVYNELRSVEEGLNDHG